MEKKYQICANCIMDTSDPVITFDEHGICNYCRQYEEQISKINKSIENKQQELNRIVNQIKEHGKGKEYDCILGISGGVDSAYLAYTAHKLGLRILAVHVDAGWNSEVAVQNIKKLCEGLGLDLYTIVIDWQTIKELQRAYMFSGLPNLDVPQDHVFLAAMYTYAQKYNIKYMLNGSNLATEGILPSSWGYTASDYVCIKDVYNKCGRKIVSLKKYPHMSTLKYFYYEYLGQIKRINLLNYVEYSQKGAIELLSKEFGWQYYGGKHFESRFTKFFQSYYLPKKFGYEKKRAHLSSLIVGGELTREEALVELDNHSAYTDEQMLEDRDYILKKLDISMEEWNGIMEAPCKSEDDYKTNKKFLLILRKMKRILKA